jgi:hypothetical protein
VESDLVLTLFATTSDYADRRVVKTEVTAELDQRATERHMRVADRRVPPATFASFRKQHP